MPNKISASIVIILVLILNMVPIMASQQNVIDDINYLTQDQEVALQETIESITSTYGLEPVIVIIDDSTVYDSIAYADDYFDYNGYGVGDDSEGILFLIDMYNRQLVISTTGNSTILRYDTQWVVMRDTIAPYLTDQKYNEACELFLDMVINVEKTGKATTYGYRLGKMAKSPIPYGVGFVIALIATVIITLSSKGKVTINSRTYESPDSFNLTHKMDQYEREHTTKRRIETKSKGGGGSRTGSSGSSHGGGGGGF